MSQQTNDAMNQQWNWQRQPQADALIRELVDEFLSHNPEAATLARRMLNETSTRFVDWVDFIRIPTSHKAAAKLTDTRLRAQACVRCSHALHPRRGRPPRRADRRWPDACGHQGRLGGRLSCDMEHHTRDADLW